MVQDVDVLVIGAGLSGVCMGYHLQKDCPGLTYAVLERREQIGGTWDLFRYPGIRSDSDMYTLGYPFKPWKSPQSIVDGASIREYITETAKEFGIYEKIQFGVHVVSANWSTPASRWEVTTASGDRYRAKFIFGATGYYSYDNPYTPDWPGFSSYQGKIIHPQFWPEGEVGEGKKVIVIGSGATAMTLVPTLARTAGHVTMLQRSPTYVASLPAKDPLWRLISWMGPGLATRIVRWKNVFMGMFVFWFCRRFPNIAKKVLLGGVVRHGRMEPVEVRKHFTPKYNPWEQRVCVVPNADLFKAIHEEKVTMKTDHIETFTPKGVRLRSGEELEADIIVTATGLTLNFFGNIAASVDGAKLDLPSKITYKGMMIQDVPNLAFATGYVNASWTLKADLVCVHLCKILKHMEQTGRPVCCPRVNDKSVQSEDIFDFSSGYFKRAADQLPKQGDRLPWKLHQNYPRDCMTFASSTVDDGALCFCRQGALPPPGVPVGRL
eukprot:TRINITY_DN2979_c0_g1_i1.p2 TRINITY_DN2979_c0_g1~~TRINITY_DN2979_c0_g1_i1.p2  ORF type:complete len:493 (+),score=159.83 TRINITY_DN2979_c0_g1_i1:79-1557(+)